MLPRLIQALWLLLLVLAVLRFVFPGVFRRSAGPIGEPPPGKKTARRGKQNIQEGEYIDYEEIK